MVEVTEELVAGEGVSVAARTTTRVASKTRSVRTAIMATGEGD